MSYPYLALGKLSFWPPLATTVFNSEVFTFLPISQLDLAQYSAAVAHADEGVEKMLGRQGLLVQSATGEQMMPMISKSLKSTPALSRRAIFVLAILTSTAWTPVAMAAEFPAIIPLSSLNGTIGFRLNGVAAGDNSGYSVASAGDVNGDGFADVIVGANYADPHGSSSGSSYVVFGKVSGFAPAINLSALDGTNGFRLDGATSNSHSSFPVASAGDVNGDGFADVAIGAPGDPHVASTGSSYVVFGKASGFPAAINLSTVDGTNTLSLLSSLSPRRNKLARLIGGEGNGAAGTAEPALKATRCRECETYLRHPNSLCPGRHRNIS